MEPIKVFPFLKGHLKALDLALEVQEAQLVYESEVLGDEICERESVLCWGCQARPHRDSVSAGPGEDGRIWTHRVTLIGQGRV